MLLGAYMLLVSLCIDYRIIGVDGIQTHGFGMNVRSGSSLNVIVADG